MTRKAQTKANPAKRARTNSAARKSHSADASFAAELRRLREMSIEDRVLEALGMGSRYAGLEPVARER